jgi:hypothetical protein
MRKKKKKTTIKVLRREMSVLEDCNNIYIKNLNCKYDMYKKKKKKLNNINLNLYIYIYIYIHSRYGRQNPFPSYPVPSPL